MLEAPWTFLGGALWTTLSCLLPEPSAMPSAQAVTELTPTTPSWLCRWQQEKISSRVSVDHNFNLSCLLLSDGPIYWPRHHPHSKSWDPVLRAKWSIPSVSVCLIWRFLSLNCKWLTYICRSFDEEKCSPIRLFSNDPFWKVTTPFLLKRPSSNLFSNNASVIFLRGRRPAWTSLEASLLLAWNVAFRQGNTFLVQYSVSTVCFQGAAEPDYSLDWWVKHLWKHWWRCRVLEGTWWKTQGNLKDIQNWVYQTLVTASRRQANEVVRDRCLLVRGSPLEKWQVAMFAAVGKR